jgi:hypothetical protein
MEAMGRPQFPVADCERVMPPAAAAPCRRLPRRTKLHSARDEVVVAMRGALTDPATLSCALSIVSELTRYSAAHAAAA